MLLELRFFPPTGLSGFLRCYDSETVKNRLPLSSKPEQFELEFFGCKIIKVFNYCSFSF